jgi:NAD(P)-dependent dehydrogenase (short-subunit alcohol dehydrogenase family)
MSATASTILTRPGPELLRQTVVIIGGSAGIGLETTRRARAEGASIILTGRNRERLEQAARELGAERTAAFDAGVSRWGGRPPSGIGVPQYGLSEPVEKEPPAMSITMIGKTPYVRFDLNDYSVPHNRVRRTLSVLADPHEVRIVDGAEVIAYHRRSYDKGARIENTAHVQALVEQKRAARQHRATDRLAQAVPASQALLIRAAERGANLGAITAALMRLLDRTSAANLQLAILEALERDVPHPNAVRLALERQREQRGDAPQVAVVLPAHVQARDAPVQPHRLETYDQLKERPDD